MTTINKSLAYSGETLIYINECELFWPGYIDPCNPLDLPPNTIRVRTKNGAAPIKNIFATYESATKVEGTTDIYDVYKSGSDLTRLLYKSTNVIEILGANTSNVTNLKEAFTGCSSLMNVALFDTSSVTNMRSMFNNCSALTTNNTTIPLFDTSNVTRMEEMFWGCYALTAIPLFNTSSVENMYETFSGCLNVETGALALYQQLSAQGIESSYHVRTFEDCGSNTTTGAAELAQIPDDWK